MAKKHKSNSKTSSVSRSTVLHDEIVNIFKEAGEQDVLDQLLEDADKNHNPKETSKIIDKLLEDE